MAATTEIALSISDEGAIGARAQSRLADKLHGARRRNALASAFGRFLALIVVTSSGSNGGKSCESMDRV